MILYWRHKKNHTTKFSALLIRNLNYRSSCASFRGKLRKYGATSWRAEPTPSVIYLPKFFQHKRYSTAIVLKLQSVRVANEAHSRTHTATQMRQLHLSTEGCMRKSERKHSIRCCRSAGDFRCECCKARFSNQWNRNETDKPTKTSHEQKRKRKINANTTCDIDSKRHCDSPTHYDRIIAR